jgi:benzoyl-CoA reductase subunit D
MSTFYTAGIDAGNSSVKVALLKFTGDDRTPELVDVELAKLRKRDPKKVIEGAWERVLGRQKLEPAQVAYVATTGDGELVDFRRGHFYSMTSHARGALFIDPSVRAVVDVGALHAKALIMDERSKVLAYRMTSQCASGSGQFIENISRYLGITIEDVGKLSLESKEPTAVSGICAVLAETDVINMVSRGIATRDILKGIHVAMAKRLVNLLRLVKAQGKILVTGGLGLDVGLVSAIRENMVGGVATEVINHELSPMAGAIGCGIWGGYRHVRLAQQPRAA